MTDETKSDHPNARVCSHGSLRRSCERCEDAARIAELEAEVERLREAGFDAIRDVRAGITEMGVAHSLELAASYERGARDAFGWAMTRDGRKIWELNAGSGILYTIAEAEVFFLASRGTAESKGEEG